jgi:hypothetical protein
MAEPAAARQRRVAYAFCMGQGTRLDVGDTAPDLALGSPEGEVRLSALWREAPLVLAFLRHFG